MYVAFIVGSPKCAAGSVAPLPAAIRRANKQSQLQPHRCVMCGAGHPVHHLTVIVMVENSSVHAPAHMSSCCVGAATGVCASSCWIKSRMCDFLAACTGYHQECPSAPPRIAALDPAVGRKQPHSAIHTHWQPKDSTVYALQCLIEVLLDLDHSRGGRRCRHMRLKNQEQLAAIRESAIARHERRATRCVAANLAVHQAAARMVAEWAPWCCQPSTGSHATSPLRPLKYKFVTGCTNAS
jgi:hypothetical protein